MNVSTSTATCVVLTTPLVTLVTNVMLGSGTPTMLTADGALEGNTDGLSEDDVGFAEKGAGDDGGLMGACVPGVKMIGDGVTGERDGDDETVGATVTGDAVTGAGVTGAEVTGAEVMGAGVVGEAVTGADVTGAEVTGAGVTGAGVTGAGVTGASVTGAAVTGAAVTGASDTGVSEGIADGTISFGKTGFSDGTMEGGALLLGALEGVDDGSWDGRCDGGSVNLSRAASTP